jgi:BASS family bile acid:Na+ symporter
MSRAVRDLSGNYLLVVAAALLFGLAAPQWAGIFSPYTTFLLAVIFFLTALKLNLTEVMRYLLDWRMVIETNLLMLLLIPLLVYYLMLLLESELALPFLILAAMPTAMTAPLVTELMGGRQGLALVATITTSLLAPLTVPLVIKFATGAQVQVGFWDMCVSLAKVIFIPFALAGLVKFGWTRVSNKLANISSPLSVILLVFIITAVISRQSGAILDSLTGGKTLYWLAWLFLLFVVLHALGYWAIFWRSVQDKFTISVCLTYMNFVLAIYLADNFFPAAEVAVPVILSVVPWALLLPLSGFVAKRWLKI